MREWRVAAVVSDWRVWGLGVEYDGMHLTTVVESMRRTS